MKVKQAMHAGAQWVEPGTPLTDLARLMQEHNIGAIPIGENDRLVGMVTGRDIVYRGLAAGLDLTKATARDVMTKGIFYRRDTRGRGGRGTHDGAEQGVPTARHRSGQAPDRRPKRRRHLADQRACNLRRDRKSRGSARPETREKVLGLQWGDHLAEPSEQSRQFD